MAFTHGCSDGWLASACVLTSALLPHMVFGRMVTQPSCTSCQHVMLAWRSKSSSRTRRVPFFSVLHHCRYPPLNSLLPLQTAPHLRTGDLTRLCLLDSTPATTLVSDGINRWVCHSSCQKRTALIFKFQRAHIKLDLFRSNPIINASNKK